ncbi:MAG: ABC transporter permease [Trueperaceae bacterium]|nr:ABC transporter permease [Trueperaceae bacterium]
MTHSVPYTRPNHWRVLAALAPAWLFGVGVLALWQLYVSASEVPVTVLPSPERIARTLVREFSTLVYHARTTLIETGLGFGLAVLSAFAFALSLDAWTWLRRALYPWLVASQTVPIVALAPLMLVWFGFGLLPKVLLVALFCFFSITVATIDGLARSDPTQLKLLSSMGASYGQTLRLVRLPAALPSIFSGLKIAVTYSVTAAIFAEYVGGYAGLGILIQTAANARSTPLVFATIVVTSLVSFALFALVGALEQAFTRWHT